MNVPAFLTHWAQSLGIYSIGDCLQIIFFMAIVYRFSTFLDTRTTKTLLTYFNAWACSFIISYWFQQQTLSLFLLFIGPLLIIGLLILHQERIQKNVIAARKIIRPSKELSSLNWIDILIKGCLQASMHNHTIKILLQRADCIEEFVETAIPLNAHLNEPLYSFLINTISYHPHNCILFNDQGIILGLDVQWIGIHGPIDWNTFAEIITMHNDTIALSCDQASMLFHVTAQGKTLNNLSATDSTHMLKTMIVKPVSKEAHDSAFFAAQSQSHKQVIS